MFERIVVSVDGSPDSNRAVEVAGEIALAKGAEVIVVHGRDIAVVAPPAATAVPPPQAEPETEDEAQRLVDEALQQLQEAESVPAAWCCRCGGASPSRSSRQRGRNPRTS